MWSEIINAIIEEYSDDKDLIANCLCYLYHSSNNATLNKFILEWIYENEYCEECGSKLVAHEIEEIHTEVYGHPIEYLRELKCPICDM